MTNLTAWVNQNTPNFISSTLLATTPAPTAEAEPVSSSLVLAAVLLTLIVIYSASKIGAEICTRINLPTVLGELVGGVVIGISALHLLVFPEGGMMASDSLIMKFLELTANLSPQQTEAVFRSQSEVISVLAELGVVILLFEVGLESDIKELLKVGPQAVTVAVVGVAAPFAGGTLGLFYLFGVPLIPAIFAGAALTATSIGITSKVLTEMGKLNTTEGNIILGAAVLDDVLGIIILAVVAGLSKTGEIEIGNVIYLIISAAVFLIGAIIVGRLLNPYFVKLINKMQTRGELLLTSLVFAFVLSYIGGVIRLEAILGSFAAGLVLAETEKQEDLQKQLFPIADMLVPIFFVAVGAKTNLGVLNPTNPTNQEALVLAGFLIFVAIVGKLITGATVFGKPGINRLAVGIGMIPRGEVGLVFVSVGAASGSLNKATEAAIIMMVIVTTFLAPPLLRLVFQSDTTKDLSEDLSKEISGALSPETPGPETK